MLGTQRVPAFDARRAEQGLRVEVWAGRDEFVLRVDGEADLATAPVLGRALVLASHESQPRVVLDVSNLRFIDAHCLGVINNARCLLREHDRDLVIRSAPPMVRHLLTICDMGALIEATDWCRSNENSSKLAMTEPA